MIRILVPTDFSDIANRGLQEAVVLGKQLGGAEIMLLNTEMSSESHSFSATGDTGSSYASEENLFMAELLRKNRARLQEMQAEYQSDAITVTPYMEVGPMKEIVDTFIHERPVDLIVMGTSGENTLEEYFVGNHTEQVINVAHVPVISVKVTDRPLEIRTMLVATDMNEKAFPGLAHIGKLADRLKCQVHLVNVTHNHLEEHREQLDRYAREHNLVDYTLAVIDDKDTEEGIKRYAAEIGADLIGVITHGRTGLASLLTHSVAHDIIREASVPVLTVNMKKLED